MNWLLVLFGVIIVQFLLGFIGRIIGGVGNETVALTARMCSIFFAATLIGALSPSDALENGVYIAAITYLLFLIITLIVPKSQRPHNASYPLVIISWLIWLPLYIIIGAISGFIGSYLGGIF
jgi:hypothetical protein